MNARKIATLALIVTLTSGCSAIAYDNDLASDRPKHQWDDIPAYSKCDTGMAWSWVDMIYGGFEVGYGIGSVAMGYPVGLVNIAWGGTLIYIGDSNMEKAENCREFKQYKAEQDYIERRNKEDKR